MYFWSWLLTKSWLFDWLQAHVRLICCSQDWVLQNPVNPNPDLKVNQSMNFFCKNVFHCFYCVYNIVWDYSNSKHKAKWHKQKTSLLSYKTQIKTLAYPGSCLSLSGFIEPCTGAPLSGLAKSLSILEVRGNKINCRDQSKSKYMYTIYSPDTVISWSFSWENPCSKGSCSSSWGTKPENKSFTHTENFQCLFF